MNVEDMFTDRRKSADRRSNPNREPVYVIDLKACDRMAIYSVIGFVCMLVIDWWTL